MFQCLDVLLCFWLPNCACRGSLLWSRRRAFDLPPVLVVQAGPSVQQIRDLVKPSKPSASTTSKGKAFAFRLKPEGNASMDLDWRDWRKSSWSLQFVGYLWAPIGLGMSWSIFCNGVFFGFDVHAVGLHICSGCDSGHNVCQAAVCATRTRYCTGALQNSALFYIGQHVSATSLAWETD